jgi:excinuclease ABC subunit B
MYADKITGSIQYTMDETERRRKRQIEYNFKHNITPTQAGKKASQTPMSGTEVTYEGKLVKAYVENEDGLTGIAADPVVQYMSEDELKKQITRIKSAMLKASKELDFVEAARLRDDMYALEKLLGNKH